MMKLQLTLKPLSNIDEKLFELFCIKNELAKYFAKCHNVFKYFVLHIVIPQNDTFLNYRAN